jgi:putative ABC transport system ATP-binding protein
MATKNQPGDSAETKKKAEAPKAKAKPKKTVAEKPATKKAPAKKAKAEKPAKPKRHPFKKRKSKAVKPEKIEIEIKEIKVDDEGHTVDKTVIKEKGAVENETSTTTTTVTEKAKAEKPTHVEKSARAGDEPTVHGDPNSPEYLANYINIQQEPINDTGVKALKQLQKRQKQLTSKYSKEILEGKIVSTTDYKPDTNKHVIELHDVTKSYITGDLETQVLKGIDIKLNKSDFIVILGPSGSGKTTFLNTISGLDKATKGDVFVLGYNLTLLKDSHLTKFRRKHVGFIFQQYNLLTNLTAKENAEVGENLAKSKNPDMTIEDIFETIGMKEQMNKYPHQMSGGQQQRVSIARALAKNPDLLFADEPTGALDEEMGRKVLQILVDVNRKYKTTVIVVTHNPNIAKIGNTVIHVKNGLIDQVIHNPKPADPETID